MEIITFRNVDDLGGLIFIINELAKIPAIDAFLSTHDLRNGEITHNNMYDIDFEYDNAIITLKGGMAA